MCTKGVRVRGAWCVVRDTGWGMGGWHLSIDDSLRRMIDEWARRSKIWRVEARE